MPAPTCDCPMVNSRAACEAFVGACRYAPRGYRSSGPIRATLLRRQRLHHQGERHGRSHGDDRDAGGARARSTRSSRRRSSTLFMSVPRILSVSLGLPHARPQRGCRRRCVARRARGLPPAWHQGRHHTGGTAYAKRMIGMGFDFVTVLSDAPPHDAGGHRDRARNARDDGRPLPA